MTKSLIHIDSIRKVLTADEVETHALIAVIAVHRRASLAEKLFNRR